MATLFVRHRVSDYDTWRRAYDEFEDVRNANGVTGHGVYQLDGDPNDVTVYHHFGTIEEARAFAASERLKEAMVAAGVQGAPDIWFTHSA